MNKYVGIIILIILWFFLHGCVSYQAYPDNHHKNKEIKVTGVVDRQVNVKYE